MPEAAAGERRSVPGILSNRRSQIRLSVLIWLVPLIVITVLVAVNPPHRNVTPLYQQASADWSARRDIYNGPGGMNYLPQFPLLFMPFHRMPIPAGDIVWRLLTAVLLATGILRFVRERPDADPAETFLLVSVFALPLCLGALRNGQANGIFAALTLQAAACLPRKQWWPAAILIVLALGVKPLGIVLLLLSAAVYAPLRWRLIPALAALVLFPFLFAPPDYVMSQYRAFIGNIQSCAVVTEHRFADIGGIVRTFGYELPGGLSKAIRAAAGLFTLWLWWSGAKRLKEPLRAMWLLALTASYLMLFNPMNESNSYVVLAPAMGLWAAAGIDLPETRRTGWIIGAISLSMAILPNVLRPLFGNHFALIWHPVMTIVFMATLVYWLRRPESPFAGAPVME